LNLAIKRKLNYRVEDAIASQPHCQPAYNGNRRHCHPCALVTVNPAFTVNPIELFDQVLSTLDLPADWIGLRAQRTTGSQCTMRDGLPQQNHRYRDQGAMVEVLVEGQLGYAAINQLTVAGLQAATHQAYRQAQAAAPWPLQTFAPTIRPRELGLYTSSVLQPPEQLSGGDINALLAQICQGLKLSAQIVQTIASLSTETTETWLVSSSGSRIQQQFTYFGTHFGATAQDGAVVQTRHHNGPYAHCYQGGWEHLAEAEDLWQSVQQVAEQAVELLTAPECPTMATTLVLAPDQMLLQIHESIGHPLELDRILGDERNYAGGSFVKAEDFGQLQYGSPLLNVTFDPTLAHQLASYGFDDTGAGAERQYLIRQGVLERGLGGQESQARAGVPGVACARATSWNRPAIDRMANINLEPGPRSFAEIIASIEDGVYMEANRSWSIDDQRHKFQFGCEYGRRIRQGRLAETLRNPNYRATTPQFWHGLVQVGNAETWQAFGTPFCGKGEPNQLIRVGHGAPVAAFQQIDVFGGAS